MLQNRELPVKINLQRAKAQFPKYQTLFANPAPGGGMHPVSAAVCSLLLEWQEARGVKGDLLEAPGFSTSIAATMSG